MAKKKPISPTQECRMSINVRRHLLDRMHAMAEQTGVPLNQLVRALLEWAAEIGRPGSEPIRNADGFVKERPQKGVFWLGRVGYSLEELMAMDAIHSDEEYEDRQRGGVDKGQEIKVFDFTERVIRRDL